MRVADEVVDRSFRADDQRLDSSVDAIARPAIEGEAAGGLDCPGPIADALYAAGYAQPPRDMAGG